MLVPINHLSLSSILLDRPFVSKKKKKKIISSDVVIIFYCAFIIPNIWSSVPEAAAGV